MPVAMWQWKHWLSPRNHGGILQPEPFHHPNAATATSAAPRYSLPHGSDTLDVTDVGEDASTGAFDFGIAGFEPVVARSIGAQTSVSLIVPAHNESDKAAALSRTTETHHSDAPKTMLRHIGSSSPHVEQPTSWINFAQNRGEAVDSSPWLCSHDPELAVDGNSSGFESATTPMSTSIRRLLTSPVEVAFVAHSVHPHIVTVPLCVPAATHTGKCSWGPQPETATSTELMCGPAILPVRNHSNRRRSTSCCSPPTSKANCRLETQPELAFRRSASKMHCHLHRSLSYSLVLNNSDSTHGMCRT